MTNRVNRPVTQSIAIPGSFYSGQLAADIRWERCLPTSNPILKAVQIQQHCPWSHSEIQDNVRKIQADPNHGKLEPSSQSMCVCHVRSLKTHKTGGRLSCRLLGSGPSNVAIGGNRRSDPHRFQRVLKNLKRTLTVFTGLACMPLEYIRIPWPPKP